MSPKTITYVAGVARSGTSWLGQIFDSSPEVRYRFQPFFSYEFKNKVNEDSSAEDFNKLFEDMYFLESSFLTQSEKRESGDYPFFKKNLNTPHLVFKENRYQYLIEPMMRKCPQINLVGIIRDPNATLNSWIKNPKEFPQTSDPLKEWRYGNCKNEGPHDFFGYYKWKEIANLYLDLKAKWPKRVFVVKYENLVESSFEVVRALYDFSGINYSEQTDLFLKKSTQEHKNSPYSVYKDKRVINQWKIELNPYIISEIKSDLEGTRLEQFLNKV